MVGIKKHVVKGVRWSAIENVGVRFMTLASFLVLARLLDKEAFGIVALALAYVAFLELVVRVGFAEVIVQRNELTDLHKDTAFWAVFTLGLLALFLAWMIAPLAARWSDNSDLESILRWLSLGIIPLSLTCVQQGVLIRNMDFRRLAIRRLAGTSAGVAVGIGCAVSGFGVWSLVAQQLVTRMVDFITLYWVTRWFPGVRFSWLCFRDMLSYGWKIMGINTLAFTRSQGDRFVIGYFFGVNALGIYVVGRRVIGVIINIMSSVIGRVALSAFSRLQSEEKKLSRAALSVAQLSAAVGFPILIFIAITGSDINLILFGDKWVQAGSIMQIAAGMGIARVAVLFAVPLYKARGMPGRVLLASGVRSVVSILLSLSLSSYGLEAMAAGWLAGEIAGAAFLLGGLSVTGIVRPGEIFRIYVGLCLAALGGAFLMFAAERFLPGSLDIPWFSLLWRLLGFTLGYLITFRFITPRAFDCVISDIRRLLTGRTRESSMVNN